MMLRQLLFRGYQEDSIKRVWLNNRYYYEVGFMENLPWENVVQLFEDANPYQTWAYGSVRWGTGSLSHLVLYNQGKPVAAAQVRLLVLRIVGRGIAYVTSGPMRKLENADCDEDVDNLIFRALYNEYVLVRNLYLRVIPYEILEKHTSLLSVLKSENFRKDANTRKYRTFLINLSPSLDELVMSLRKSWRKNLRRAQREPITISEGSDDGLFGQFLHLYSEMYDRKGFDEALDVREFRDIQKLFPEKMKFHILVAAYGEEALSGMMWSEIGRTGLIMFSATGHKGLTMNSSYLLRWTMLERMKERGCRFLDQGGIDPVANPDGYAYKRGFGGDDVEHIGTYWSCKSVISYIVVRFSELVRRYI